MQKHRELGNGGQASKEAAAQAALAASAFLEKEALDHHKTEEWVGEGGRVRAWLQEED